MFLRCRASRRATSSGDIAGAAPGRPAGAARSGPRRGSTWTRMPSDGSAARSSRSSGAARGDRPAADRSQWPVDQAVHSIRRLTRRSPMVRESEEDRTAVQDLHEDGRRRHDGPAGRRPGVQGRHPRRGLRDGRRAERRAGPGPGPRPGRRRRCPGRPAPGRAVRPRLGAGRPVPRRAVSQRDHRRARRAPRIGDRRAGGRARARSPSSSCRAERRPPRSSTWRGRSAAAPSGWPSTLARQPGAGRPRGDRSST